MITVYYRITTDNSDGNIALTVSNPQLNIIAELTVTKKYNDGNHEYDIEIVREYMGGVTGITDVTNSKNELDVSLIQAIKSEYAKRPVAINCDNAWISRSYSTPLFDRPMVGKSFPMYIIVDGADISMQTYDYFWDDDPKFQKTFRDGTGGNHQWLLYWCNAGGRSGMADISEVSVNSTTYPILDYLFNTGDSKRLLDFIEKECEVKSLPEFNRKHAYVVDRLKIHEENKVEDNSQYAIQDVRSAIGRKDTAVWYEEYKEMGFDHPRPDYRDKKWKL